MSVISIIKNDFFPNDSKRDIERKPLCSNFAKIDFREMATSYDSLHVKIIKKLDACETLLDTWISPLKIQNSYDQMINEISQAFNAPSTNWNQFNAWLDDTGNGSWFSQLAMFVAKLPLKPARNIIRLTANIVQVALTTTSEIFMHPMKSVVKLAKLLIELTNYLIQPETWTRLGVGVLGTSLANLTVASNPLAVVSIALGAALTFLGISVGTLKTVLIQKDVKGYLIEQAKTVSEDLLTSYCLCLLLQAVQRSIRICQKAYYNRLNQRAIDKVNSANQRIISESQSTFIDQQKSQFLEKYHLPEATIYEKGDLSFKVRWHIERATHGDLKLNELSEGKLVIENLQTHILETKADVWIEGYSKTEYVKHTIWDKATNSTKVVVEPVITHVPGHWDVAITKTPIYEKFFGYDIPVEGWVEPPLLPLPPEVPVPLNPPISFDPRMAALAQPILGYMDDSKKEDLR